MLTKTILTLVVLAFAGVSAGSDEGVYLVNGREFENGDIFSEFAYYSNAKGASQNQQKPDATTGVSDHGYQTWEGQEICRTFSGSGETFCSDIDSNASSLSTGDYAGYAYNNEQNFNCYKDNGRTLYSVEGEAFQSIYYCFDA